MSASRLLTSSLLCKNNCGFYGNPSWDGYCSVCYRAVCIQQGSLRSVAVTMPTNSSQPSKFDTKRLQMAGKGANTFRNLFQFTRNVTHDKPSTLSEECYQATNEFNVFLGTLKGSIGGDISRMVTRLLEELDTMAGSHIDQYSLTIQNFYCSVFTRTTESALYSGLSPSTLENIMNAIERFLTSWIHNWAFASAITDDETVDLMLQEKIRSLHWITPELLDSPIDPKSPGVIEALDAATVALIKMNAMHSSEDKLEQIVQCCLSVFNALKGRYGDQSQTNLNKSIVLPSPDVVIENVSSTSLEPSLPDHTPATADDFLPTLIWIILRANPPMLHSNLQFIMRFANQKRLNSGQAAYFFTNICCAAHFLTNLTHASLHLTEREFHHCMRTGLPTAYRKHTHTDGERKLVDNELFLSDLEERVGDFEKKLDLLEQTQADFDSDVQRKVENLRHLFSAVSLPDNLDPRHLETPHVFLLGPLPHLPGKNMMNSESILDLGVDESTNRLLPAPILPSPYHSHTSNS